MREVFWYYEKRQNQGVFRPLTLLWILNLIYEKNKSLKVMLSRTRIQQCATPQSICPHRYIFKSHLLIKVNNSELLTSWDVDSVLEKVSANYIFNKKAFSSM